MIGQADIKHGNVRCSQIESCRNDVKYEGRSISFEPGYLGLYFWAEKCCRPDLLTLISVL